MAEWYLATYQNSVFSNDLGIIQPSGDYVYKLKNPIKSGESPEKEDWLRISITNTDNKVEEWDGSSWTPVDEGVTGLMNESTYWVYGKPYSYRIVANDQTYYLESFRNSQNGDKRTIADSDVSIDVTTITAVTIGPSVTEIGKDAFYYCISLASLTISKSVKTIGKSAFASCSSLVYVTIPDSVTSIGYKAFDGCSSLEYVTIGDSVETIGESAFYNCINLASVTIPNSVKTIGNYAFYYCTRLAYIRIGKLVETIGEEAFYEINSSNSDEANIRISQNVLTNLNTKYSTTLSYNTEQFFFSGATKVTLNVI